MTSVKLLSRVFITTFGFGKTKKTEGPDRMLVSTSGFKRTAVAQPSTRKLATHCSDSAAKQAMTYVPRTLVSHALSDYTQCFIRYRTADILVYDPNPKTRETTRVKASKIIIKGKPMMRHQKAGHRGTIDMGRNATVNICSDRREMVERLVTKGETYAVVLISDQEFRSGGGEVSLVRTLRESGYEHAIAFLCDQCSLSLSAKCRDHGFDACLVRNTGTMTIELTRLVSALSIRCQASFRDRRTLSVSDMVGDMAGDTNSNSSDDDEDGVAIDAKTSRGPASI